MYLGSYGAACTLSALVPTRQLVLNANGSCDGCARLPRVADSVGVVRSVAAAPAYECAAARGSCGVQPVTWPNGTEELLPSFLRASLSLLSG